jgi:hypothetical protein
MKMTGEFRFSGLDIVAMEDEEVEITVAATVQNNLDSTDAEEKLTWTVTAASALRFFDADGVATTDTWCSCRQTKKQHFTLEDCWNR